MKWIRIIKWPGFLKSGRLPGTDNSRDYFFCVILPILVFSTIFLLVNWNFFTGPLMELGDDAAYALQILDAKNFDALLGPYSRFGFHHPGPILFYYHAIMEPFLWFIPTPMGKHLLAQFLLNLFFLFLLLQIIYQLYKKKHLVYLFFFCILTGLLPISPEVYFSLWPPYVLVIPMILFSISAIGVASGQSRCIPEFAVSAVIILQYNVSGAVIVLPIGAIATVLFLLRQNKDPLHRSRRKKLTLIITLLFIVISFAPPLLEEFRSDQGNLTKISQFLQKQNPGNHSFKKISRFLLRYYYSPVVKIIRPGSPTGASPFTKNLLLLLFLVLAINLIRRFKRIPKTTVYLSLFLVIAVILSFLGAANVPGKLLNYIFFYQFGFVSLLYFVLLSGLFDYIQSVKIKDVIPIVFMIFVILVIGFRHYKRVPGKTAFTLVNTLIDTIQPQKHYTYELFFRINGKHNQQWPIAAGVALKLRRMGYKFCVLKEWELVFGNHLCRGIPANIQRISFYSPRHFQSPVREKSLALKKTIIEFGKLRKISLPVKIHFNSPDEYFQNWDAASPIARAFSGKKASIVIPIDPAAGTLKRCRLELVGHSADKRRRFKLTVNGHLLSEMSFSHTETDKKTVDFDANLLNTQEPALLELQCDETNEINQERKDSIVFVFNSLQIAALE